MALETETNKVICLGNGATTVFSYSFIIPTAGDAVVTFTDDEGTQTILVPAQYTITGLDDPNGGTITYPLVGSPMASGETLTLQRIVSYTQPTVLTNQGNFYPDVVEGADDYIVMQTQQLAEAVARSIRFPAVDPAVNSIAELSAWQTRANKAFFFDSSGNPEFLDMSGGAATSAANVNFLQAGVGAISRTVQSKERDIVSVLDFIPSAQHAGIKARTSVYDCTADFAAAVATDPGALYFPSGTYKGVIAVTTAAQSLHLVGAGRDQTVLVNNSVGTDMVSFAANLGMCSIDGFSLNNNSVPTNALTVLCNYFKGTNLKIFNHGNTTTDDKAGLYHSLATLISFENVDFFDNDLAYGSHINNDRCIGASYINVSAGKGCTTVAAKPGIYIFGATVVTFEALYVDPGSGGSMFLDECNSVTINGLSGENDVSRNHTGALGMFKFTNTGSLTINGLYFNQHATTLGSVIPILYLDELDECSIRGVRFLRDANESAVPMLVMQDLSGFRLTDVTLGNWTNTGHGTPLNFLFSNNDYASIGRGGERYEFKNISSEAGTPSFTWVNVEGIISENVRGTYTMSGTTAWIGTEDQYSPAFSADITSPILNVTGDAGGTVYTILFSPEEFDTNGNYNPATGLFTAPVGGRYQFNTSVRLSGLDASHTLGLITFVTSAGSDYVISEGNYAAMRSAGNMLSISGGAFITLAQGTTVKVTVAVTGTAQTVDIETVSSFSGFLLK